MAFTFNHCNINVSDLDRAIKFYGDALGLTVDRIRDASDGSFRLAFLTDGQTGFRLELTCLVSHPQPYELGENESHLCLTADDFEAAHAHHAQMNCICYENTAMGVYFICDPDGYWTEIVRAKK